MSTHAHPLSDLIAEAVAAQVAANHAAIEEGVERMLVSGGDRGVLVTYRSDGTVVVELSSEVPWGTIGYWWRAGA